jgi:DNA polymerase-3 subunit delta
MARGARPGPLQAIVGPDTYLAEEALETVLARVVGNDRTGSVQVVYGDEAKWEELVASAQTGSLFVAQRAIVVRRADQTKGDEERIVAYADDPSPDATLILMAPKPDRRRKVWKQILKKAQVHSAQPKRGRALRAHVEAELGHRGLRLAPEAVEELIDRVGQDLRRLMGEVDKLEAFGTGQRSLSAEDVAKVLGRGLGRPLYLLGDAISGRRRRDSLALIDELMGDGEEGLRILATLHRSLRQVRAAGALREAGVRTDEIGRRLLPGNMQFKARALVEASRRWVDEDLRRAFAALGRADRQIKRGTDAETALAAAVVEACGGGGEPGRAEGARPSPPRGR